MSHLLEEQHLGSRDQAIANNSLFVGVTETWLTEGVLDSEVLHDFQGFSLLRCDRAGGRQGGGVCLYVRDDLSADTLASYSNSVCELLIVKILQIDTVVCVAYRRPDTKLAEFAGLLKCLEDTLSVLPTPSPTIVLMGDFNLGHRNVVWRQSEEGFLVPDVAGHHEEEPAGGKQDRLQAQQLIDLAEKHCLLQEVDKPTHSIEILDLVFTNNCELVSSVLVEDWTSFTDHRLVIVHTSYQLTADPEVTEQQYLCDTGRRYSKLDFNKAPWEDISAELGAINWEAMEDIATTSPTGALVHFHEKVLHIMEKLVPIKAKRSQSRPKMHRMRRLLWKRLAKVRRSLKTASSVHKLSELLQKMWELESQLEADYNAVNSMEEDEAVLRIKSNSKCFYSFARSRQKVKAKVGPFLDEDGKPNPSSDFAAEALRKQYDSVFAQPRPSWSVTDFRTHFHAQGGEDILGDIEFGPADIEKACAELRQSAAPGPDGVPAILLKKCRKELSTPIYHLWRSSLDSGVIPTELLLVLICPVHKGGTRSAPKNYRPVALTSHLIKVFERVVRHALVNHIERHGLLPDGQHGSRAMRSTLTQLLSHWDNILEGLEQGQGVDCVYLDFSKAFDKVETGVLLHKLRDGKVLGKVGCWLAAFLDSSNRQQAVVVNGRISDLSPVISGVPQGTVLGPVLFLLHIADIAREVSQETATSSYVDDTRANRSIADTATDCQALQDDLAGIYRWAEDVNMVFNLDKFECLRFWPGKTRPASQISPTSLLMALL